MNFADALLESCERKRSRVVVGLDPRADLLPPLVRCESLADRYVEFCRGILEATAEFAAAAKPQIAFFEELGPAGLGAFRQVCAAARAAGLPVIADVKRGDIADTAEAYARTYLEEFPCDAVTLSPYLGRDSVEPFLQRCRERGKGVFVLAKTSNPSSAEFQDLEAAGEPLYRKVARAVRGWGEGLRGERGYSSAGIVVGATHRVQTADLRAACPDLLFLVPGYGAQGAGAADAAAAFDARGLGAVVNASRSILYAWRQGGYNDSRWAQAAADATRKMRDEIQAALAR
jgi:orotidine-5'-phosphate decarboxylase